MQLGCIIFGLMSFCQFICQNKAWNNLTESKNMLDHIVASSGIELDNSLNVEIPTVNTVWSLHDYKFWFHLAVIETAAIWRNIILRSSIIFGS